MSAVQIKQIRSANGTNPDQKATLKALGLGRIGKAVERKDSPQLQGQLRVVSHLVEVSADGRDASLRGDRAAQPEAEAGLETAAQADRARRGQRPGQDLRPRPQGRRLARGRQAKGRLRGRPEPDSHADAKAARPAHEEVDAVRELPHQDAAGQPRRPRGALRGRRRSDRRRRSRRRAWPSARTRSRSSPAARSRRSWTFTRTPSAPPPKRRSRRPAVPVTLWSRNAQNYSQRVQRCRHSQEACLHGGDAGAVPPRRLHPGAGRRRRRPSRKSRTTSAAPTSSASSTSSRAAASRASASSRWGSCPTSPPRSSCSC